MARKKIDVVTGERFHWLVVLRLEIVKASVEV
jgi:hypothetical protein